MVVGRMPFLIVDLMAGIRIMKNYHLIIKQYSRKIIFATALTLVVIICLSFILVARKISAESALQIVQKREDIENQLIGFSTRQIKSYAHEVGYKEIKQIGVKGKKAIYYTSQIRGDGILFSRDKTDEKIISQPIEQIEIIGAKLPNALTKAKSAQTFVDSKGVAHRETYYDLPMGVVIGACGSGSYSVREDGAKIDKDGYVLVAANYGNYPRCSVVETSMGPGKVYDTGGFAKRHPHGFDLATDWTNGNGR